VVGAFVAGWVGDTVILGLHSSEQVVLQCVFKYQPYNTEEPVHRLS